MVQQQQPAHVGPTTCTSQFQGLLSVIFTMVFRVVNQTAGRESIIVLAVLQNILRDTWTFPSKETPSPQGLFAVITVTKVDCLGFRTAMPGRHSQGSMQALQDQNC